MPEAVIDNNIKKAEQAAINKSEKIALFKVIGTRMKEARNLTGLTQKKAAEKLKYANSSKLAKIEKASEGEAPSIFTLFRASKLYSVSLDFLYGESGDWERDPIVSQERQIGAMLYEASSNAIAKQMTIIGLFCKKQAVTEKNLSKFKGRVDDIQGAFNHMKELNPNCEDEWKGLAKVQRLIIEAVEEAAGIDRELKRNKIMADMAKSTEDVNMDIFKEGEE